MNKDALWALLVVILLTSMAAMMLDRDDEQTTSEPDIQPEQQETDDIVQDEPIVEPPHDDGHLHPAPILSLISAEDDGSMISMSGYVIHGHPDQVLVDVFYLNESIVEFTPDASGLWNLTVNTEDTGTVSLNFTATHTVPSANPFNQTGALCSVNYDVIFDSIQNLTQYLPPLENVGLIYTQVILRY